uniref:Exonuclease domain-containing protein n=1 Tax=Magallana gigas TaxID=29159 RepID=A0A8W8P0H3_MAGGI
MSPGRFTVKYTTKLANSLKRKRLLQAQRSAKRRRLELKSERLSKDATHSVLEGETYSTNIGFDECTDIEDITFPSKEFSVDSSSLIVFDLETTGLEELFNCIYPENLHIQPERDLWSIIDIFLNLDDTPQEINKQCSIIYIKCLQWL